MSHDAIMDAVFELLEQSSVRDLSMDQIAKRAGVGKPTLYKWWPTKAALVLAMFHERLAALPESTDAESFEAWIRARVQRLISEFHGAFGKVMVDLIAEGQSAPAILQDLYDQHVGLRRAATVKRIELARVSGEFRADVNPEIVVDAIFGPIYFRLLMRNPPLDNKFGDELVDQVLRGVRRRNASN